MEDQQVQQMSDAAALDELAAYLRGHDEWDGGDFCELGARVVSATGRQWEAEQVREWVGPSTFTRPPSKAGLFDIRISAEQLKAAAAWAAEGENIADVELLADDRMLVVSQGDDRAAFDTGGEPGSDEYVRLAPLDR